MSKLDEAVKAFEAGGARVIRGAAVPAEKRKRLSEIAEEYTGLLKSRRPVPLWRVHGARRFVYEDERCTLVLPIPRLDVFTAFFEELRQLPDAIGEENTGAALDTLARCFVVLHMRPRFWQRRWIPQFNIDTERARNFLMNRLPADVVLASLPLAFVEFYAHVTGIKKKKDEDETPTSAD